MKLKPYFMSQGKPTSREYHCPTFTMLRGAFSGEVLLVHPPIWVTYVWLLFLN
jgi:hypothetical protein